MFFGSIYNSVGSYITQGYQMAKSLVKATYNSTKYITDMVGYGLRSAQQIVNAIQDIPIVQENLPPYTQPSLNYVLDVYTGFENVVYNELPRIGTLIDTGIMDLFSLLGFTQPVEASA